MEPKDKLVYLLKQPTFIIIVGYFYIISTIQFAFNPYDSGVIQTGAMRILNGELPYKDFFTMYAPGQFYLNAFLQLFTNEVLVIRIFLSFIQLASLILVSKISREVFDDKFHIYSVIMSFLWLGGMEIYDRAVCTSLFWVLFLIFLLIKLEKRYKNKYLILIGLTLGFTSFFRHDIGIFAIFFSNLYLIFKSIKQNNFKLYFKEFGFMLLGFLPLILYIIYLLFNVEFKLIYNDLVLIPQNVFIKYRSLPFPNPFKSFEPIAIIKNTLLAFSFYIPFITLALLIMKVIKTKVIENFEIILAFGILIFINQMLIRSELEHTIPAAVLSSLLYFHLLKQVFNFKLIILVGFLIFLPNLLKKKVIIIKDLGTEISKSEIEGIKNIYIASSYNSDLSNTISFIKNNTKPSEKIYCGLKDHSYTFISESSMYFLTNRQPATKYHELHPGITTTEKIQYEMIKEIKSNNVNYIVLKENLKSMETIIDDGIILDKYINDNYELVQQFGVFYIYKKII